MKLRCEQKQRQHVFYRLRDLIIALLIMYCNHPYYHSYHFLTMLSLIKKLIQIISRAQDTFTAVCGVKAPCRAVMCLNVGPKAKTVHCQRHNQPIHIDCKCLIIPYWSAKVMNRSTSPTKVSRLSPMPHIMYACSVF